MQISIGILNIENDQNFEYVMVEKQENKRYIEYKIYK